MIEAIEHIAAVAPAGKLAPELLADGVAFWRAQGKRVTVLPHVEAGGAPGYLSGPATVRARELEEAWCCGEFDAVWCVRGGFGSAQLLPLLDWHKMRRSNATLPVIGYSDITALHMAMLKNECGTPVVAPMLGKCAAAFGEAGEEARWRRQMLDSALGARLDGEILPIALEVFRAGTVSGMPLAANLTVLMTLAGTAYWPDFRDKILIIEDLNEPIYKLDRMLTQLEQNGVFKQISGLLFGEFLDCGPEKERVALFQRIAAQVAGPVLGGFPFGHGILPAALNLCSPIAVTPSEITINCRRKRKC